MRKNTTVRDFQELLSYVHRRFEKKEDREALWEAVAKGEVDMLGTDHCSFNMKDQKTRGKDDFTRIPDGLRGCPVAEYGKVHTE